MKDNIFHKDKRTDSGILVIQKKFQERNHGSSQLDQDKLYNNECTMHNFVLGTKMFHKTLK